MMTTRFAQPSARRRSIFRLLQGGPLATVLTLTAVVAELLGCGGSNTSKTNGITELTPTEVLETSKRAAEGASSVTIHSTSQAGGGKLSSDLELSRDGGKGKVTLLGRQFEVIRAGQAFYVKGPASLYQQLGIKKPLPRGAWVKLPAQNSLAAFTDLAGETTRIISTGGTVTKGATTMVDGQPALELKTEGKLYKGRLYIKTTGQPYPIRLDKHGRETAQFAFTGWDQPVSITAPSKTTSATD